MPSDPYQVLGVAATASDAELRSAYRRLVQLHHPDHNGGSAESARRFEEVQEAYAAARRLRSGRGGAGDGRSGAAGGRTPDGAAAPPTDPDPDIEARLAQMERELQRARAVRERAVRQARRAAAEAATANQPERPSDEELGYFSSDDSFTKILDDVAEELSDRWTEARATPAAHRLSDLIDDLASKLTGERPHRK